MKLEDYAKLAEGKRCVSCGRTIPAIRQIRPVSETPPRGWVLEYYPHDGGWDVDGFPHKLWLYIVCPKCHYQSALWKIGIPRQGVG